MKKILALLVVFTVAVTCLVQVTATASTVYVSVDGNDSNSGSFKYPVASLTRAVQLVGSGNATICFKGGTYKIKSTANLSGVKNLKIVNYNNEKVVLTGSDNIDTKLFKKVTDTEILNRISDSDARENLVAVNMNDAGITELGAVSMCGFGYPSVSPAPQLVINGERQTLARYPDDDYLLIDQVVKGSAESSGWNEKEKAFSFRVNDNKLSGWQNADDLFVFGYFNNEWADATLACSIDFDDNNLVSTEYPSVYGVKANRRVYFMNLLEEISVPGEWYLDRNTATLYAYTTEDFYNSEVEFVNGTKTFIKIDNSENVTIKGIDFRNSLGSVIVGKATKNATIKNCDFNNIADTVVNITESYDAEISWCNFNEIGGTGIYLSGGVRQELIPGNCIITNCVFDGFQRVKPTGAPGINVRGVGNTVSHNVLKDGANIAIWFGGNNHVIEYNDISDVCTDTADAGAIYAGRDWTSRGNEVRYNYIHDMNIIDTTTGMKIYAVYLDDGFSSAKVHGNVIKDVSSIALYGGGRYNTFENNIVIGGQGKFIIDKRFTTWDQTDIRANSAAVDITHEAWKKAYPEIQTLYEDEPGVPKYNSVKNNVSVGAPGYNIADLARQYALAMEPDLEADTDIFVDYNGGDLTLKADAEVFETLPDFKPINFNAIGLEEKPADELPDVPEYKEQIEVWQIDFENQDYSQIFTNTAVTDKKWTDEGLVVTNLDYQGRFNSKTITWEAGARYVFEYTWKANVAPKSSGYGLYWHAKVGSAVQSLKSSLKTDEWTTVKFTVDNITEDIRTSFFLLDWDQNVEGGASFIIKDFKITYTPAGLIPYDNLDLSRTDTIMSTGDIPRKIAVDGYKLGVCVKENADDSFITYESSDSSVASVDANGYVTAHKNGIAKITVSAKTEHIDIKKSVMFIVGPSTENDCETASTSNSSKVSFSDFGRNDSHSWKYSGAGEKTIVSTMNVKEQVPVVLCWFYDDGTATSKGVVRATGKSNSNPYLNIWLNVDASGYSGTNGNGLSNTGLVKNTIKATKGWHQAVFAIDGDDLAVYVDGQLVMKGTMTAKDKAFIGLTWYENSAPSGSVIYYDDIAFSDIYAKAAPSVAVSTEVTNGGAVIDKENPENILFANSYVVYATITNYEDIVNYGMTLKRVADGKTLDLASQYDDSVVVEKLGGADGQFAFKVYGKAIDESKCTLTPYIQTKDGILSGNKSEEFGGN